MDHSAGAPPKMHAASSEDVACKNTPCREDLNDAGLQHGDRGVGPWMLVTHKKKAPKAAPLKNFWKASHVKPVGSPAHGVGPSSLGSQSRYQELPPSIGSQSPSRYVKEKQCMEDVRPPMMENCEPQSAEIDQPPVMENCEPQSAEKDQLVSLVFTSLSKRDRQLDVPKPPTKLPAKVRSRGDKIRGAKKERMVCELGPVTPGSRKRHKAQSITDGGDGSTFEEP